MIKSTAIDPTVLDEDGVYRLIGPARVFASERAAIAAIKGSDGAPIEPGDVMVIAGRGPLGSGMEETAQVTLALKFLPFGRHVALITDARFSGVSTGACIGHVSPEALEGGPIGRLLDGDLISVEVDREKLVASVDLVGRVKSGGRPMRRRPSSQRARSGLTLLPTSACRLIPRSGPGCSRQVGASGADVSTTTRRSARYSTMLRVAARSDLRSGAGRGLDRTVARVYVPRVPRSEQQTGLEGS